MATYLVLYINNGKHFKKEVKATTLDKCKQKVNHLNWFSIMPTHDKPFNLRHIQ